MVAYHCSTPFVLLQHLLFSIYIHKNEKLKSFWNIETPLFKCARKKTLIVCISFVYVIGQLKDMKNYITGLFTGTDKPTEPLRKLVGLVFCHLPLTISRHDIPLVNQKGILKSMEYLLRPFLRVLCLRSLPPFRKTLHFFTPTITITQSFWWDFGLVSTSCSPKMLNIVNFWVIF